MGLTQGALFRHFPTKDAILQAVLSWVAERLLARVDRAVDGAPSSLAALEAVFMTHVDFVAEHPGVPRMLFGELQRSADNLPRKMVQTLIRSEEHTSELQSLMRISYTVFCLKKKKAIK